MSGAPCMFCGKYPCECNGPKKPKGKPKITPTVDKPIVHDAPSPMASARFEAAAPKVASPMDAGKAKRSGVMEYAIEVLLISGIVHRDDVPKLRRRIAGHKTPELIAKVRDWRKRNGQA